MVPEPEENDCATSPFQADVPFPVKRSLVISGDEADIVKWLEKFKSGKLFSCFISVAVSLTVDEDSLDDEPIPFELLPDK